MTYVLCCLLTVALFAQQAGYVLGPEDQITIQAPDVEEISGKPVRIDLRGNISLPLIGRIEAGGLTAPQLGVLIKERFQRYPRPPHISVSVPEVRSHTLSVLGAVQSADTHPHP